MVRRKRRLGEQKDDKKDAKGKEEKKGKEEGKKEKENGWYIIPDKLDNVSYYLLIFFVISIVLLVLINE